MDSEIERSLLTKFGNDLWLERRLRLDDILTYLEGGEFRGQANESPAGKLDLDSWIEFVKFLKLNCSGETFDLDKQWSELLNLMQISRKLNHKSLRFKDLIKNRQAIEANAKSIKLFNEATKLSRTIESLLEDLDSRVKNECQLELRPRSSKDRNGNDDDNNLTLLEELSAAQSYVGDKCMSILYRLKLELDNELVANEYRIKLWREQIDSLQVSIEMILTFLDGLYELETKFAHLKPLLSVERFEAKLERKIVQKQQQQQQRSLNINLNLDLDLCKEKFESIRSFHENLINSLEELVLKSKPIRKQSSQRRELITINHKLPLIKLLNSKHQFVSELYGSKLREASKELDECKQLLDSIMQKLRLEFGRFYFVNDLELLTIMALDLHLATDETIENKYLLSKLFNESINAFLLNDNQTLILGVKSPHDEVILFPTNSSRDHQPIEVRKKVNLYSIEIVRILNETIRKLRRTLRWLLIEKCLKNEHNFTSTHQPDDDDWSLPVQVINLGEQVKFCSRVESALSPESNLQSDATGAKLSKLIEFYEQRFKQLSKLTEQRNSTHSNQHWLDEFKKVGLISQAVQFISTLVMLQDNRVQQVNDWNWQKRPRFYLTANGQDVEVRILDSIFAYKFDYLPLQIDGQQSKLASHHSRASSSIVAHKRLIDTQITERCFLSASQSVRQFRLGANPFGPAGSGKTETIKGLGNLLGRQVIVQNCDESNDAKSLERLIWGLAHSGLWGCFDEFNRLAATVLSSISSTLELVQSSIRLNISTVELPDKSLVSLDQDGAFFITLNPSDGLRYRGRRQLPANLRNLFLPISMVRVDIGSIVGENLLTLIGQLNLSSTATEFRSKHSLGLGRNLSDWLDWMRCQQSSGAISGRCEFDLRLVMAILRRLTKSLFDADLSQRAGIDLEQLLVESIEREIVPRLALAAERQLLQDALSESFSGLIKENQRTISEQTAASSRPADQLADQLENRTGVLLLGQSGSGKSSTWRQLAARNQRPIKWYAINPKSCNRRELFGQVDELTGKWIDGLLTARVREASETLQKQQAEIEQVWIVLDGPIDPDWVESLNSVLDDNQVLTLSSGERLNFSVSPSKSIKLIFETTNIGFASPATISRLGLVYLEQLSSVRQQRVESLANIEEYQRFLAEFSADNSQTATQLIVVLADNPASSSLRLPENDECLKSNLWIEYNCNQLSRANHLAEFVTRARRISMNGRQDLSIVLNNVDLIENDDQWQVKSFLELLRFMLTYGGFYDKGQQYTFIPFRAKFIVPIKSAKSIDERTLSLATVIELNFSLARDCFLGERSIDFSGQNDEFLGEDLMNTFVEPIASFWLTEKSDLANVKEQILAKHTCKVYEFTNSNLASQSMAHLEELLKIGESRAEAGQDLRDGNSMDLFVLTSSELELIDVRLREKLLDRLNWLNLLAERKAGIVSGKMVKFIYLSCRQADDQTRESSFARLGFWSSMGQIYQLEEENFIERARKRISQFAMQEKSGGKQISSVWLAGKLEELIIGPSAHRFESLRRFDEFLATLSSLSTNFRANLNHQCKTYSIGLHRLSEFESSVEQVKVRCKLEQEDLTRKRGEIEQLMGEIDSALRDSERQSEKIKNLRSEQEDKSQSVERQKKLLEQEMEKVLPLIESSKSEIRRHLKAEAINEIKTLRSPPKTIKDILDVLFVLLEIEDSSWMSVKSYLTRNSLKDELTNYDFKSRLSPELLAKAEAEICNKEDSFSSQQAARASKAILPILNWIKATLEYGRVSIKAKPMNEKLERFREELAEIERVGNEFSRQQEEIEVKIKMNNSKLTKLKCDFDESHEKLNNIRSQLDASQRVRLELGGQISRWKTRVSSLEQLLDTNYLVKLCLMSTLLALQFVGNLKGELEFWFQFCDLAEMKVEKFVGIVLDFILENEYAESFAHKPEQIDLILQLVGIRLKQQTISEQSKLSSPYFLNSNARASDQELIDYLTYKSILCQAKDLMLIKCTTSKQWREEIELNLKLNKLLTISLPKNTSISTGIDLDLIDLIRVSQSPGKRMILVGKLDNYSSSLRQQVHAITLPVADFRSVGKDISGCIMNNLIQIYDSKLSHSIEELETKLEAKQRDFKRLELNLLEQLTLRGSARDGDLSGDLIRILSELHRMSSVLSEDIEKMKEKLDELQAKRAEYSQLSVEAAQLYERFLINLSSADAFYRVSLQNYIQLMVEQQKTVVGGGHILHKNVNYHAILERVMLSMRPIDRVNLGASIRDDAKLAGEILSSHRDYATIGLRDAILSLAESMRACEANPELDIRRKRKLMVVLHDSKKSSPQAEVDQLFKGIESWCKYVKFYATGASPESRLESLLQSELISPSKLTSGGKNLPSRRDDDSDEGAKQSSNWLSCVCVTNAHLSARWLNKELIGLLRQPDSSAGLLVILIGESSASASGDWPEEYRFEPELLDEAELKYWYDELTLNKQDRFNTLSRSMIRTTDKQWTEDKLGELSKKLIQFHVECQERSKMAERSLGKCDGEQVGDANLMDQVDCWTKCYNFDYNQLCIAIETLRNLARQNAQGNLLSQTFSHYLEHIIYGARMETLEDEQLLSRLIGEFFLSLRNFV